MPELGQKGGETAADRVRAILLAHALRRSGSGSPAADPNSLAPAPPLRWALEALRERKGDEAVRGVARDYVALWARTFRTLVAHLRGRPERAQVLLAADLPTPYLLFQEGVHFILILAD